MVNNLAKKDIGWNMSKKICNIDYQMKNARLVCLIRTETLVSASADVAFTFFHGKKVGSSGEKNK